MVHKINSTADDAMIFMEYRELDDVQIYTVA